MRVLALLIALLVGGQSGCMVPRTKEVQQVSVAIAIRVSDGSPPSPQQITNIHTAMAAYLSHAGYRVAQNTGSADLIATIGFTPSATDPSGGRISIIGVEPAAEFRSALSSQSYDPAKEALKALRSIQDMADRRLAPST